MNGWTPLIRLTDDPYNMRKADAPSSGSLYYRRGGNLRVLAVRLQIALSLPLSSFQVCFTTSTNVIMGGTPSKPADRSRTLQVIGAGYSRTGTISMAMALEKLLDGPAFHGGTQLLGREDGMITASHLLSPFAKSEKGHQSTIANH